MMKYIFTLIILLTVFESTAFAQSCAPLPKKEYCSASSWGVNCRAVGTCTLRSEPFCSSTSNPTESIFNAGGYTPTYSENPTCQAKEQDCQYIPDEYKAAYGCVTDPCEEAKEMFSPPASDCNFEYRISETCWSADGRVTNYTIQIKASDGRIASTPVDVLPGVEPDKCWPGSTYGGEPDDWGPFAPTPSDNTPGGDPGGGDPGGGDPGGGDPGGGDPGGGDPGGGDPGGGDPGGGDPGGGDPGGGDPGGGDPGGGDPGGGDPGGGGDDPNGKDYDGLLGTIIGFLDKISGAANKMNDSANEAIIKFDNAAKETGDGIRAVYDILKTASEQMREDMEKSSQTVDDSVKSSGETVSESVKESGQSIVEAINSLGEKLDENESDGWYEKCVYVDSQGFYKVREECSGGSGSGPGSNAEISGKVSDAVSQLQTVNEHLANISNKISGLGNGSGEGSGPDYTASLDGIAQRLDSIGEQLGKGAGDGEDDGEEPFDGNFGNQGDAEAAAGGSFGDGDGEYSLGRGQSEHQGWLDGLLSRGAVSNIKNHKYIVTAGANCSVSTTIFRKPFTLSLCEYQSQLVFLGTILFNLAGLVGLVLILRR